jgi:hypothetical protein
MYGRLAVGRDAAGKPIYVPWRISNHVNTVVPVREVTGASGAGKYYDALYGVDAGVDPRLTTSGQSSRGSFDLFVPRGRETGVRFDWQEPYDLTGFYGGPRMGGPRDWGGIARGSGLWKQSAATAITAPQEYGIVADPGSPDRAIDLPEVLREMVHLQKAAAAAAAPQALTPPASNYKPPAGVPAPKPAQPVRATVPLIGVSTHGYAGATAPAGTYASVQSARAALQAAAKAPQGGATVSNAQSAAQYAGRGLNYLANHPEFHRRVGGGDAARGRALVGDATWDLERLPVVNEAVRTGGAMAHTRNGAGSYVSMPARTVDATTKYPGGGGPWRNGAMTHEVAHPFANKIPGYVGRIQAIQAEEGLQGTNQYHRTPKEQAAEFNAVRVLKGAWPGHGAGKGGAYTPEQADSILDDRNPYFKGLPTNYKMRLLNEARNRYMYTPAYGVAQHGVV